MEFLQNVSRLHFFKEKPGYDWWTGVLKMWPKLAERKLQHLQLRKCFIEAIKPTEADKKIQRKHKVL